MLTNQAQPASPVMFCHDSTSIFYPTAPGRVYIISITALADCDGSDEDYSDSTMQGDILTMIGNLATNPKPVQVGYTPSAWPAEEAEEESDGCTNDVVQAAYKVRDADFQDALEQWADWCDRDSVRLDSLDEIMGAIERAA